MLEMITWYSVCAIELKSVFLITIVEEWKACPLRYGTDKCVHKNGLEMVSFRSNIHKSLDIQD